MSPLRLPAALWWDHNAHYHRAVLRRLPPPPATVLDAGCGAGRLACLLAATGYTVTALDRDAGMVTRARARCAGPTFLQGDLRDEDLLAPDRGGPGGFDAVTAVSSLHHLPLAAGLDRLAGLVRPGGVLVVVGHHRRDGALDAAVDAVALPANALVGAWLRVRGRTGKPDDVGMPVQDPTATLREVRAAARARLPGARVRRALFWRHLLVWRRPTAAG